jgi:hypothetical protein
MEKLTLVPEICLEEISVTQLKLKICFTRLSQSERGPKFYE